MTFDLHEYYTGETFTAWEYFGAHLARTTTTFRVYAPGAPKVSLIGDFSDWEEIPMKQKEKSGVWEVKVPKTKEGMLYKYRIYFEDGQHCDHMDPFAFSSEKRPGTASRIANINFRFSDKNWIKKRDLNYNKPMNIYEVHLGSWRTKEDGTPYTYSEIAEELADYALENGYTHIEFMPLTEYPADESWGYQVLGFYAATSRYGTPKELMSLVNTMHKKGIGVILDFVPVHFALDYYGLARFDGSALYEYDNDDTGYSEWGSHNFNFFRGEVRSFLQSAADFWIEKYHIDGIRIDAVSNALFWQGNKDRGVNEGALDFFQYMNAGLKKRFPSVMKIAEDSSDYLKVTAPVDYDGLGFDYKWDLGWMNDTLDFFKFDKNDRGGYIAKIQWSMFYFYNELFILPLSHDEVVHGKKSILDKMIGSYEEKFMQARLLYLYMMTHPGKKLNFMGNEFGHFAEWSESHQLDWDLLRFPTHIDFHDYIKGLNAFYLSHPALYEQDYNMDDFRWWNTSRYEVLAYQRTCKGQKLLVVLNFGGQDLTELRIDFEGQKDLTCVYTTEPYIKYPKITTSLQTQDEDGASYFIIDLPAFGGVVFEVEEKQK